MLNIKKHKSEILISLITGIFFLYAERLFNFLGSLLVKYYLVISKTFSKEYYNSIARNDQFQFDAGSNFILNLAFSGLLLFLLFQTYYKKTKLKDKISKRIDKISQQKEDILRTENAPQITLENYLKNLDDSKTRLNDIKKRVEKIDYSFYMMITATTVCIIIFFSNYAINKSVVNENITFNNDITKIKPFVNDLTIDQIRSKWAQIQSVNDFENIKAQIDSIKKIHKIK